MFSRRTLLNLFISGSVVATLSLGLSACGGPAPKVATVQAGDMPEGGDWTGVYFDQTNGYLHIVKEGDTVSGKWRTAAGDSWGEMSGKVTGNLYKYEWKEHRIGLVGPSATRSGKGYFVYSIPKEGEAHAIDGQWGLGMDETGMKWKGVKQMNMRPDPNSVMPDEVENRGTGGGWDSQPTPPKGGGDEGSGDEEQKDEGSDMPAPVD
jgi:hypothetical protein